MFASTRTLGMILVACVATTTASAQNVAAAMIADSGTVAPTLAPVPPPAGPRIDVTAVAVRHASVAAEPLPALAPRSAGMGKPMALVLVGLAGIVVGDVMDDDIGTLFSVGGAVCLLVGLYQLLK